MSTKGKTRWYPRNVYPTRNGFYECHVRLMGGANTLWMLEWDGAGFRVPMPMIVHRWRGQTKKAAHGIKGEA